MLYIRVIKIISSLLIAIHSNVTFYKEPKVACIQNILASHLISYY